MLLFSQNQTANWLKSKDGQEKKKLIKACIRVGRDQRKLYKQRKNDIQLHREKVIQEKKEALVKKRRQKEGKKTYSVYQNITSGILDVRGRCHSKPVKATN